MTIRKLKLLAATSVAIIGFATPPAFAQDVYENAVADHGMRVQHDSMARHNLEYAQNRQRARRGTSGPSARKAEICAELPRYRREYGASNPKVLKLQGMCARDGY